MPYLANIKQVHNKIKDLLSLSLVFLEKAVLLYCGFQEPSMNQVQSLYCHIQRGRRQCSRLRNPAAICQQH